MLALRREQRRDLARANDQDCYRDRSGDRVDSAPGLDRRCGQVFAGGPVFPDCVPNRADRALCGRARSVDLVSDADTVVDLQQSGAAASGPDLLWTVSVAAIVLGQSGRTLGPAPEG